MSEWVQLLGVVCVCTCMYVVTNIWRGMQDKVLIKGKVPFIALCQVNTSKKYTLLMHLLGF